MQPQFVICSDLARTHQTARLLGYESPQLDPLWREADLGEWTNRFTADLLKESQKDYLAWREGKLTPPGGETWEALNTRVRKALDTIIRNGRVNLIVTHGGPIRAVCSQLLNLEPANVAPVNPASITTIEVQARPRLSGYNFTL